MSVEKAVRKYVRSREQGDVGLALLLAFLMGLTGVAVLVSIGKIDVATAVKYAPWTCVGLAGLLVLVVIGTETPTDDAICTGLFITGLGGALGTYLIDSGHVVAGTLTYIGLGLLFLVILLNFTKQTREYLER